MNHNGLFLLPLLVLASFIAVLPAVMPVKATNGITIAQQRNYHAGAQGQCASMNSCTIAMVSNVQANNVFVISVEGQAFSGTQSFTATDTLGTTFTKNCGQISSSNYWVCLFYGTISAGGADTFTIDAVGGHPQSNYGVYIAELGVPAGTSINTVCFKTAWQNLVSPPYQTANCTWTAANYFDLSGEFNSASAADDPSGGAITKCATGAFIAQCGYSLTQTSPDNFRYNDMAGGGSIVEAGMVVQFATTVSVTAIAPCTFFQLQCWWYPLLFMSLYSGVLLLVASMLKTSSKGKAHIFLSAVTFGSLVAVILGIMNIVFPLIMLVVNTIIALRLRG